MPVALLVTQAGNELRWSSIFAFAVHGILHHQVQLVFRSRLQHRVEMLVDGEAIEILSHLTHPDHGGYVNGTSGETTTAAVDAEGVLESVSTHLVRLASISLYARHRT